MRLRSATRPLSNEKASWGDRVAFFLRQVTRGRVLIAVAFLAVGVVVALHQPRLPDHIILIKTPKADQATAQVILPYPVGQGVMAHYTEHLAWLNAVGRSARGVDRHSNAWTNDVSVGYWLGGGAQDLPDTLTRLAGVFAPITLPTSFMVEERDIVLREYGFRMAGNPDGRAFDAMDAFLYHGNPLAASVIGTPAQINALDPAAAVEFHAQTHRFDRAVLIVSGDVTPRDLRRALRAADWPLGDVAPPAPPQFVLAPPDAITLRYPDADVAPRLIWRHLVALPAPVDFDQLQVQTALLRDILDTNLDGGLVQALMAGEGAARSVQIDLWPLDETHVEISVTAAPDRGVPLGMVQARIIAALAQLAADGVPEASYQRVSDRFWYWPDWQDQDAVADWMASYVADMAAIQRMPRSRAQLRAMDAPIPRTAINDILRALAGPGRSAAAFIGPRELFE